MFIHHTKTKGDLGVLKVKIDLCLQGFLISTPETEHAPFDLIIYKKGTCKSVQVKYRNMTQSGKIEIPFSNSYSTSHGVITRKVNKAFIDLYAIYCPQTDACNYLEPKNYKNSISLRVKTPRNYQRLRIHYAEDFRKVP
ncbi:MAG: hypothetical protein FJX92_03695 [Bacteroidetes bacterium]|nr:hypothetical protein [Bacteroidota bacterium]